jgi:hypothetical protein
MTKRIFRKPLAFFLAMIMVIGLFPEVAVASPDSITTYVTVSISGQIPTGTDNSCIAQIPVTVTDHNNNSAFDIDDALFAVHEAYYTGGAASGYSSEVKAWGLGLTKLWGDTSGAYGYWVNNVSANSLADTISAGDYITAYVYADSTAWSDSYTKFDSFTKTALVGEDIPLKLEKAGYDASWNTVWSDLPGASVYDISDDNVVLATTNASGEATVSFSAIGTYYITVSYPSATIVPPVCKITITEPAHYGTVRIEGNGFGTDGTHSDIGTVLKNTMVNLDTLPLGYKAINVVNAALTKNGLTTAAGSGGFYNSFGGVSGASGQYWRFMLNDEAGSGLDSQAISAGDDIVLMLTGSSPAPDYFDTTSYIYFKTVSSSSNVKYGYAYGEVTLKLYSKTQIGVDASWNPTWSVTPVANAPIYSNESQAWTPDNDSAVTDAENGVSTITLWGGQNAGTYYFDISATVDGATSAYCRAKMVYDGVNAPTLSFSAPSANDTTLSALTLTFPGAAASNGLSYVGTSGMHVENAVQSVTLAATVNDSNATITATYKDADDTVASTYTLGESTDLAIGENTFKLTVTNGADTQIHTLVIMRKAAETRNIPNEVASVINGVKTVTGDAPYTDWILAMNAAGFSPTDAQIQTYLASVLATVDSFVDNGGNPATMAKIAIALTSLGIDARQIPDPDGGEAVDLVRAAAADYDVKSDLYPVYSAPYLLSLYDLGNYEVLTGAASTRLELIDAILDAEADWTAWGYDGVGMVLPALAPYYNATAPVNGINLAKCQEVTSAVNRALASMSTAQTIDGGFGTPNSNTVSTVITGLNAIGINSNSNSNFIKGATSLLMNLLSFRTSDDKLGYNDATSANPLACVQGFQAFATWQNLSNTRSSNLYHFTKEIAPYTNWPSAQLLTGIVVTTLPKTVNYHLGTAGTTPDTSGIVVTATYNADPSNTKAINIANCTISAIDCTTAGTKTVTVTYQGKMATFFVTVLDANGNTPKQNTVSVTVSNNSHVIARNSVVVIEAGVTSALDILKTVLNAAGKTYVIRNGSYVAEINGLGEFDEGANSGWLYSVNGVTLATTAANDYLLSDGDTVLWYYTLDYTTDTSSSGWTSPVTNKNTLTPSVAVSNGVASASVSATDLTSAIAAVKENKGAAITIEPIITGTTKKVAVDIPKGSLSDISSQTTAGVAVKTPVGSVIIPNETLNSITSQAMGSTVTVTLESVASTSLTAEQKETAGENPVYDISILSGGTNISSFGSGSITVSLPYTLKEGEDASNVTVWYLSDSGELQLMDCTFDKATGLASFTTTHLSYYMVGYDVWESPFTDVKSDDWFYGAVKYAVQKGLFNGTSDATFTPNDNMTRAMLVTVLYRLEGNPSVTGVSSFTDIQGSQWYTDAVTWASTNMIVSGYGGGLFGTNDNISREQMAAILYRYAQYKGHDVTKTVDLKDYKDALNISTWASDAMKWASAEGLITGTTSTLLSPTDSASRAQVATILMRFANN